MSPKSQSEAVKRAQQLADKARNEMQKSILLRERARLSYENVSKPVMRVTSELQQESKKLREKSRKLRKTG